MVQDGYFKEHMEGTNEVAKEAGWVRVAPRYFYIEHRENSEAPRHANILFSFYKGLSSRIYFNQTRGTTTSEAIPIEASVKES